MTEQSKQVIELSDGKNAIVGEFKGKHILAAQRIAGEDKDKMMFALIAACVKIDGKAIMIEDLDEMPGPDVLKLMGEFSENF